MEASYLGRMLCGELVNIFRDISRDLLENDIQNQSSVHFCVALIRDNVSVVPALIERDKCLRLIFSH